MRKRKATYQFVRNPVFKRARRMPRTTGNRAVNPMLMRTGGNLASTSRVGRDELKFKDTVLDNVTYGAAGTINVLNNMSQGTDSIARIGRRINMKSVFIRYMLDSNFTENIFFRTILVVDMQSNGALPAWTDIFVDTNSTTLTNLNNRDRFRILLDRQDVIEPGISGGGPIAIGTGNAGGATICFKQLYKKLNFVTTYNAGIQGTIADIQTGALLLCTIASVTNAGQGTYTTLLKCRIRFTDP